MVTNEQAEQVVEILQSHPEIAYTRIIGSVRRQGFGRDLDLKLFVRKEYAEQFVQHLQDVADLDERIGEWAPPRNNRSAADLREKLSVQILGSAFEELLNQAKSIIAPDAIDLILEASAT